MMADICRYESIFRDELEGKHVRVISVEMGEKPFELIMKGYIEGKYTRSVR